MKIIHSNQFESIFSILTDQEVIFIIPPFQRPYAWEERHVNDLFQDMIKASSLNGGHYLSTFYLIELDSSEFVNNNSVFLNLQDNVDLKKLRSAYVMDGTIQDKYNSLIQLYIVVDGQQRLTSLFLLGHLFAGLCNQNVFNKFYVTLRDGVTIIPRLIQHPSDDHRFFASLIQQLKLPSSSFNASPFKVLDNLLDNNAIFEIS